MGRQFHDVPDGNPTTQTTSKPVIKYLRLDKFTAFNKARLEFSPGLNVIIGENGLGKTHLLKVAYSILAILSRGERESQSPTPTKEYLEGALGKKLQSVFMPDELGHLVERNYKQSSVSLSFEHSIHDIGFEFSSASRSKTKVTNLPDDWIYKSPVYLPTRELMSIHSGFVSLYDNVHTPFDETWRDTCLLLEAPLAKGAREAQIRHMLHPLEKLMGGQITIGPTGFYLESDRGLLEMNLVGEGLRKLAMIARLIASATLTEGSCLFWDEPESNLNPRLIKQIANTLFKLSQQGVQIFIATHSLFLLRELHILQLQDKRNNAKSRYFGLTRSESNSSVTIDQASSIEEIGHITSLDEDLSQSGRFMDETSAY